MYIYTHTYSYIYIYIYICKHPVQTNIAGCFCRNIRQTYLIRKPNYRCSNIQIGYVCDNFAIFVLLEIPLRGFPFQVKFSDKIQNT